MCSSPANNLWLCIAVWVTGRERHEYAPVSEACLPSITNMCRPRKKHRSTCSDPKVQNDSTSSVFKDQFNGLKVSRVATKYSSYTFWTPKVRRMEVEARTCLNLKNIKGSYVSETFSRCLYLMLSTKTGKFWTMTLGHHVTAMSSEFSIPVARKCILLVPRLISICRRVGICTSIEHKKQLINW